MDWKLAFIICFPIKNWPSPSSSSDRIKTGRKWWKTKIIISQRQRSDSLKICHLLVFTCSQFHMGYYNLFSLCGSFAFFVLIGLYNSLNINKDRILRKIINFLKKCKKTIESFTFWVDWLCFNTIEWEFNEFYEINWVYG